LKVTKKNILHVVLAMNPGGAERLVADFTENTNHEMYNVSVCCLDEIGELGRELILKGFKVISLGRNPGIDWKLIRNLKRYVKEEDIDIIHAHQYTPFFYSALAKNISKRPRIIFTEHGRTYPDVRRPKRVFFNPLLSRFASEIVSISEATKKAMVDFDNLPNQRIRVIYNGMELKDIFPERHEKLRELGVNENDFILVTAARLDPIKNHLMMIRAFEKVYAEEKSCKLLIAGDGPEYEKLIREIEKRGMTDHVRLLGYRNDVADIFSAADIFLLSSLTEGTSMTLLEAMNAGLPAIVTNVGGNPEVLKDGETGLLVESDDDGAMAERIMFLHNNRSKARSLGDKAKERARTLFSFKNMMDQYEELYKKCVE